MDKEIVIAAYDKELSWVSNLNSEVKQTIYRKGVIIPLSDNEIFIENNAGRCVHTFFNHIYTNYDNLSDYTFFCQDFPFDHWGNMIEIVNGDMNNLHNTAELPIGGYYGYHNNTFGTAWTLHGMSPTTHHGSGSVLTCVSNGNPQDNNPNINVDMYWDILFDQINPPLYEFMPGGHFVINKEHVKIRSREFYHKITDLLLSDVNAPWMIERLECYIFNPKYKTKL
tara:strand:- start:1136 stop:1810 length:675 start_codon:yes stop_codon:yes gene_type:complete